MRQWFKNKHHWSPVVQPTRVAPLLLSKKIDTLFFCFCFSAKSPNDKEEEHWTASIEIRTDVSRDTEEKSRVDEAGSGKA